MYEWNVIDVRIHQGWSVTVSNAHPDFFAPKTGRVSRACPFNPLQTELFEYIESRVLHWQASELWIRQ